MIYYVSINYDHETIFDERLLFGDEIRNPERQFTDALIEMVIDWGYDAGKLEVEMSAIEDEYWDGATAPGHLDPLAAQVLLHSGDLHEPEDR